VLFSIAFITAEFPPDNGKGGIGTYVSQLAEALAAFGAEVHVFAGSPYREETEIVRGYSVHWIKFNHLQQYREKVADCFAAVHTAAPFDLMESAEIGYNAILVKQRFPHLPLVVRAHAPNHLVEQTKRTYYNFAVKARFFLGALRRLKWDLGYWRKYNPLLDEEYKFTMMADYISCPSFAMQKWLSDQWQIEPARVDMFPNIFLPSDQLLQIDLPGKQSENIVLFFGRLNVLKGLVNATLAMKVILKRYPQWRFWLVGDDGAGPLLGTTMKKWIEEELELYADRLSFFPGVPHHEIPKYLSVANIVLLPSLFESFSYTCAEAMSAARPVIGSKAGGMAGMIEHGKSGILVNPHCVAEMVSAVQTIVENETYRNELALAARETVLSKIGSAEISRSIFQYYLNIVNLNEQKN
jgi:glycosyltransferase involved in cell wall biosynthesis